jgi:hypothetical protein
MRRRRTWRQQTADADVCRRMQKYADVSWRILTYPDVSWLIAYADVCWRMLSYADVCWRMLTYVQAEDPAAADSRSSSSSSKSPSLRPNPHYSKLSRSSRTSIWSMELSLKLCQHVHPQEALPTANPPVFEVQCLASSFEEESFFLLFPCPVVARCLLFCFCIIWSRE